MPQQAPTPGPERRRFLWGVGLGLLGTAAVIYAVGSWLDAPLVEFVGFMVGACTFLPMPADAWVLSVAAELSADASTAAVIGLLGGLVNAVVVLVERAWVLRFVDHPSFDRLKAFVGTNRWVERSRRHLFLGLLIGGFSFLPFEPFRLVAILSGYSRVRYVLATFLGRGFRYYLLATVGIMFDDLGVIRYAVWVSLAAFAIGLYRSYRDMELDDRPKGSVGEAT